MWRQGEVFEPHFPLASRQRIPHVRKMSDTSTRTALLITDEITARVIAEGLSELFEPEDLAIAAFEIASIEAAADARTIKAGRQMADGTLLPAPDEPWRLEMHFAEIPDEVAIRDLVAGFAGKAAAAALTFETIDKKDWVAAALAGLKPVEAGRFIVHGAHDRDTIPLNKIGIEIEAALAFGTGHHGTTRGCLLHADALLKRRKPRRIVDIGTGTGVLAFGMAKALKQTIRAGELDRESTRIAVENARLNCVHSYVRPVQAAGLSHPNLRRTRHFDLIFANILARPLRKLAPDIARAASYDATLILSGLLARDVPGILSAYRACGFTLLARRDLEGWASLSLTRTGAKPIRA